LTYSGKIGQKIGKTAYIEAGVPRMHPEQKSPNCPAEPNSTKCPAEDNHQNVPTQFSPSKNAQQ